MKVGDHLAEPGWRKAASETAMTSNASLALLSQRHRQWAVGRKRRLLDVNLKADALRNVSGAGRALPAAAR